MSGKSSIQVSAQNSLNSYLLDIFVEKVRTTVEDWDLPALYFYLSLAFRGIVTSKIDNAYSKQKLQMWRLSATSRFCFEFSECLSTHKVGAN